jgi:hypothetical protein
MVKALDTLWVKGLLYKVTFLNFPSYLVKTKSSSFDCRTFETSFETATSTSRVMLARLAQGIFLSRVLFSLYINDIPTRSRHVELAQYADNTTLIPTSRDPSLLVGYLEAYLGGLELGYYYGYAPRCVARGDSHPSVTCATSNQRLKCSSWGGGGNHHAHCLGSSKWKEAMVAAAKAAQGERAEKNGVTSRLPARNSAPARHSPEQEKLGRGWNHVVQGSRAVKVQTTIDPFPIHLPRV